MRAELVRYNGDLKVVNAARVSFDRESTVFSEADRKLLSYLAKHNHWSPFGHAHLVFLRRMPVKEMIVWQNCSGAGFKRHLINYFNDEVVFLERGSLYAYIRNIEYLPDELVSCLVTRYPASCEAFGIEGSTFVFTPDFDWTDVVEDENEFAEHLRKRAIYMHPYDMGLFIAPSFRVKATIYVARQLVKHQVDLCWNEVSRRYVRPGMDPDDPTIGRPEFEETPEWRYAAPNVKQGSSDQTLSEKDKEEADKLHRIALQTARFTYEKLLQLGVAPEQARINLPLTLLTEWIWTGSLEAFARVCKLRLDAHAQAETRTIALHINQWLAAKYPRTWAELMNDD